MQKSIFLLLTFLCLSILQAQETTLLRVDMRHTPVKKLADAGFEIDHGEMFPGRFWLYQFTREEIQLLNELRVSYSEVLPDAKELQLRSAPCDPSVLPVPETPANFRLGKMAGYYRYEEMEAILDSMHLLYPHLITRKIPIDTIRTHEGRPVYYVRISNDPNQDQDKPAVLYTALHHAREPMSLTQLVMYMWYLLENYETSSEVRELIDSSELFFIPCINPDGYVHNQTTKPEGGGLWRKNKWRNNAGTLRGVDLNRNYGSHWGYDNSGSSPSESANTFRGVAAFSEPETRAVKFLTEKYLPSVALNYHTYGNYLVHPYGYTDIKTPDDHIFKKIAEAYALSNDFKIGNSYETVGYPVNGDSDDWMYEGITGHKTFAFTPEVGTAADGFWPESYKILHTAKSTLASNIIFGKFAHGYFNYSLFDSRFIAGKEASRIPFYIYKLGVRRGATGIDFRVISNNATLEQTSFTFNIFAGSTYHNELVVTPTPGIAHGEEIALEVTRSMNSITAKDTLTLIYTNSLKGIFNAAIDAGALTTDSWGLSDVHYVSPGTSYTDSPEGGYAPNRINTMLWNEKITLPADTTYYLSYAAKWDIEKVFDYAQVFVLANGIRKPLCGRYSVTGGVFQPIEEPIYEGKQDWVRELISLEAFKGQEIQIGFLMGSDSLGSADGIYVDDLAVFGPSGAKVSNRVQQFDSWSIYPNPVAAGSALTINGAAAGTQAVLMDLLGNEVWSQVIRSENHRSSIPDLPAGTYLLHLQSEKGKYGVQKVIIR